MNKITKIFLFLTLALTALAGLDYAVASTSVLRGPANCTGTWADCTNVFSSDDLYATGRTVTGVWRTYNFVFAATSSPTTTVISNVKVGVQSSTMPGVIIGNNVIIGPSTVVKKNIPSNVTYYTKFQEIVEEKNT